MKVKQRYYTFLPKNLSICITVFFLYTEVCLFAQSPYSSKISSVQVAARPLKDSILLRWAPINYDTWDKGNKYGYRVIRYTILRDSTLVDNPQPKELTTGPLKPLPLEQWKDLVMSNKYCAIAAQAIYGESFEVDPGKGFNPQKVYTIAQEQQQRFAFALYAADISPEVAKASGLWITDKTALPNEKYLYRVILAIPKEVNLKTDTGYVFTGIPAYQPLPQPVEFKVKFENRLALISWNAFVQNSIYIGYLIEQSADGGKTYQQIHIDPIAYVIPEGGVAPELMFKYDSLPENDKEYLYRMRGITSFGEKGPYSSIVHGMGTKSISSAPHLVKFEMIKGKVKLFWEFPTEAQKEILNFKILRSDNDKTGFKILSDKIMPSVREFTDNSPLGTGYYKMVAWHDSIKNKESFPFLVQLTDSIPPDMPVGLSGTADSAGIVRLKWTPNKETDLFGYRVFRSVSGQDEYSQLTHAPITKTFFMDTLNKQDLNASVYYKIIAVDQRQNQSDFSKILEVKKPDLIPPSAPVFKAINSLEGGINIAWINSSSKDIDKHILYRKFKGDSAWVTVREFEPKKKETETTFTDKDAEPGKNLVYKVEAIDKSGNHSKPAISIEVTGLKSFFKPGITKIRKTIDDKNGKITIDWAMPNEEVLHFWIYRKTTDTGYTLYETIPGNKNSFEDHGLKAGNKYYYRIKVIYKDQSVSAFSEEINCVF
jgi:uncharacterized protein